MNNDALAIPASAPADSPRDRSHRFFVGLGLFCMLLVAIGFGPSFYDYFKGTYYFPPSVHVHGAIMFSWLVLFTIQATLASRGNMRLHRRLGWIAVCVAAAVVLSMCVATVVAFQRYDPDKMGFLVKPLLIQIGSIVLFPLFVTWAVLMRRQPLWHKRLMALATVGLVQAAVDRMQWIPEILPMFWDNGIRLYVLLLLPLFVFDAVTLKRIHPATLAGTAIIVAMHAVVSLYWSDQGWDQLARSFWMWVR